MYHISLVVMTQFIGKLRKNSQPGEKKVYSFLDQAFQDEKTDFCYYEPNLGGPKPDFILISPQLGVVIIEVKDYSSEYLWKIDQNDEWVLKGEKGEYSKPNPFNQLYEYWTILMNRIDKSKVFRNLPHIIQQILVFPFLSKKSEKAKEIQSMPLPNISIFYREDFSSIDHFKNSLIHSRSDVFELSTDHVKILRFLTVHSSRVPTVEQQPIYEYFPPADVLKVLDKEQEKIAINLGDGHRLFFGVAGSGKTILLVARLAFLAKRNEDWRFLVLCYNRLLAEYLRKLINRTQYKAFIEIANFHKWAKSKITNSGPPYSTDYNIQFEEAKRTSNLNKFFNVTVPRLLNRIIDADLISQYDAILVDEAQDFDAEWLKCLVRLLNPNTNSLLVTCDGMQGIYARKRFYWKDVNIQAPGRVRKFRRSYRNPSQIGRIAYRFLLMDQKLGSLIEQKDEFLEPREFSRKGGTLDFRVFDDYSQENQALVNTIQKYIKDKKSILLLYNRDLSKSNFDHPLVNLLDHRGIEWYNLKKKGLEKRGLYIGTIQGTKGLEADVVIIPELDKISSSTSKRQLVYVGMTRALNALLITASGRNEFTSDIEHIQQTMQENRRIVQEIKTGERCYFCKETKYNGSEKLLCISCWTRLKNKEICQLCGTSLSLDYDEKSLARIPESKFGLYTCSTCSTCVTDHCFHCGEQKSPEKGKPLCKNCYSTLVPVWAMASERFYSNEL